MTERSRIMYMWCEKCDWASQWQLPLSTEQAAEVLELASKTHHENTECLAPLVVAGSPKE